jgi:DNA (cytosine-5)-methyltransferase 1
MRTDKDTKYTFIDLFAGCGGLTEGFYKQGFKALTHVEYDHFACESLRKRMKFYDYPDEKISVLENDITSEEILSLIENEIENESVDLIIGGPPCQAYSSLGRAKDENRMQSDPRNFLFESYEKILTHFKPKIFVFENVTGLLTAKLGNQKILNIILDKLGENYKLISDPNNMVLNSCEYGVPQVRKRIILIGVRKDVKINPKDIYNGIIKTHYSPEAPEKDKSNRKKFVSVRDAISDLPHLKPGEGKKVINYSGNNWNEFLETIRSKNDKLIFDHVARNHNDSDKKRYHEMSKNNWTYKELLEKRPDLNHIKQRVFDNSYVVQFWDLPARTIIAHLYKDGNQFIHPDSTQERTLTPREAARLQSFPDDFLFEGSKTQQYKQIGNAVPPLMAEAIAKSIKKSLSEL